MAPASRTSPRKSAAKSKTYATHEESDLSVDNKSDSSAAELDSDALDSDGGGSEPANKKRKRGSTSPQKPKNSRTVTKKESPKKKRRRAEEEEDEEDQDDSDDPPDDEQMVVVGKVVKAPIEGRVPPGQISQNTLNFLSELAKPECNDREWFKLHEPVFRQAEKEWKDWIEEFTPLLTEADDQIPPLPPKDVIHRIYRDVRFSNDKTPYKKGFSASFSRSGRKGIFAHFIPGGQSLVAAGAWQPGKNELATMRHHIQHNSSRLRDIISAPEFVEFFGEPLPHPQGERRNVFGGEDELKTAPKGIDKTHKDIDLLKLRSVAVIHHFLDSEVTAEDFKQNLLKVIGVMRPLVHCLNDYMTLPVSDDDSD